jgi:pimeloyl-ACP methyl ester carboxylesterase/DNA-binding CsgD family transcriptional regulator
MEDQEVLGKGGDRPATEPSGEPAVAPRIRYATARDGTGIACWTLGRGAPLVYLAGGPWSHIELWQLQACRRWYARLAARRCLVRYDQRGTGLSERDVADYSLAAQVLDVEAVVERVGLDRFALFGAADAGPVALAYAARYPQRVSRLVLWCAWARGADAASPRLRAWRTLLRHDWELTTETCAQLALGWSAGEAGRRAAAHLRQSATPEGMRAALDASAAFDATPFLERVEAPVLVLHRRDIPWLPVGIARDLAARLRDARLVVLEGEATAPYFGDTEAVAEAVDEFLGEPEATAEAGRAAPWAGGAAATPSPAARPGHGPSGGLTAREVEVLRLLVAGKTNGEIAEELVLSVRTVERHAANIYRKLGARGRADATARALTRGLL